MVRTCRTVARWLAAVSFMACTHDRTDDPEPVDPEASAPAQCEPERIEAFPAGEPVWTQPEVEACAAACPSAETRCRREQCESSDAHDACVLDSLDACLTEPDATCRKAWEDYSCCSLGCEGSELSEMALFTCIARKCGAELDAYADCTDAAIEADDPCVAHAEVACVSP